MDAKSASAIVALRPAIERLIVHASEEPESISTLNEADSKIIEVIKELCSFNSGRYNLSPILFDQGNRTCYKRPLNDPTCDAPNSKSRFFDRGDYSSRGSSYNQNRGSYRGFSPRGGAFIGRGRGNSRGFGGSNSGFRGYNCGFRGNGTGFN